MSDKTESWDKDEKLVELCKKAGLSCLGDQLASQMTIEALAYALAHGESADASRIASHEHVKMNLKAARDRAQKTLYELAKTEIRAHDGRVTVHLHGTFGVNRLAELINDQCFHHGVAQGQLAMAAAKSEAKAERHAVIEPSRMETAN